MTGSYTFAPRLRWGAARRLRGAGPADRLALLAALAGVLLAVWAVRALEARLTDLVLQETADRAADQVRLGLAPRLAADDFAPPYAPEKLASLERRLEPFVARMREEGSGLIRLHIHARDGTILYSDAPALVGQTVPPDTVPFLAGALAGSLGTEYSALIDPDDADLRARYDQALKVHVPLVLDGQVVGAYQVYQDPAALSALQTLIRGGAVALLFLLLPLGYGLSRLARRGERAPEPPEAPEAPPAPPALGLAAAAAAGLTPREREVLALMAANCTYREIAERLVLSEGTVRTHAKNILRKLHQPDRAQAVIAAMRTGLLHLPSSPSTDVTGPLPSTDQRASGGARPICADLVGAAWR
jgi:DNA-binding CsgD family transcriptional regulator